MTKSSKATMAEASGQKLLDAAVPVIRAKGYSAARVEDICAEAGSHQGPVLPSFRQQGSLRDRRSGTPGALKR